MFKAKNYVQNNKPNVTQDNKETVAKERKLSKSKNPVSHFFSKFNKIKPSQKHAHREAQKHHETPKKRGP